MILDNFVCELRTMVIAESFDIKTYSEDTSDQRCFSNWKFRNDITKSVISAESSTAWSGGPPMNAVDGIYPWGNKNLFKTLSTDPSPWSRFDFGTTKTLAKIIVKTRTETTTFFC